MNYGGAMLSSKYRLIKQLTPEIVPKTLFVPPETDDETLWKEVSKSNISYPLIVKPDQAERGKGVEKIEHYQDLQKYNAHYHHVPFLIQEYIDYPIELGILFYWNTEGKPEISSVTLKSFCTITGNGVDRVETLIRRNHRIVHRKKIIAERFKNQWDTVLKKGEKLLIEPIGNHNRGTMFLDGRDFISEDMVRWVENCAKQLPNFDYGRFDLKIKDWNAFCPTQKNKVKILEVNGVNSEPCHIYDPAYSLWNAYRDIFYHMRVIYQISEKKTENLHPKYSLFDFLKKGCRVLLNKTP